ncbi:MAG TPA: DHA2 family efflux MFS transporter permease subunit [Stellaceae bacterium]|nr:DHA2 family efflux MFS transporter permease subunit [Stellaceae bacterium]
MSAGDSAVAGALPRAAPAGADRLMITISVMLATVMQVIDTTIANVALPHMQGGLSATQDQIAWVLTSYIVAAAVMTPITGWISGRFGRRRLLLISVVGFTIASLLCGAAQSLVQIVLFRLLQGLCGAALVPLSQAILLDVYPPEKHGQAMALWGVGVMLGPIFGPTLGGWLTETYSWRWVFYINLPIGVLAFLGILAFVGEHRAERSRPFDFFGFAVLSLAIGACQMMLDRGELRDWFASGEIVTEAALAGLGLYVFIVHSATAKHPFFDPRLLRDRNFVAGILCISVVGVVLFATLALLPPLMQDLLDYPVITAGLVLAPRGIGTMISMMIVGRLMMRVDPRLLMLSGLVLTAASLYAMTGFSLGMDLWFLIWTGTSQGLGLGLVFAPLSVLAFTTLPPQLRTEAAGIFSLMRNIGASIGISVVETLLARSIQVNHAEMAEQVQPYSAALRALPADSLWNLHTLSGIAMLDREINRQAAMIAYIADFKFMMVVTLAIVPLLLFLRRPQRAPVTPEQLEGAVEAALD